MRAVPESERNMYLGQNPCVYDLQLISVHPVSGERVDFTRYLSRDWTKQISVQESLDAPSLELTATFQRRFDYADLTPGNPPGNIEALLTSVGPVGVPIIVNHGGPTAKNYPSIPVPTMPIGLDFLVELWTSIGYDNYQGAEHISFLPGLKIFEGHVTEFDAGGDVLKITARDACHDLTQVFIVPLSQGPAVPSTSAPQPGGDEEFEVING